MLLSLQRQQPDSWARPAAGRGRGRRLQRHRTGPRCVGAAGEHIMQSLAWKFRAPVPDAVTSCSCTCSSPGICSSKYTLPGVVQICYATDASAGIGCVRRCAYTVLRSCAGVGAGLRAVGAAGLPLLRGGQRRRRSGVIPLLTPRLGTRPPPAACRTPPCSARSAAVACFAHDSMALETTAARGEAHSPTQHAAAASAT